MIDVYNVFSVIDYIYNISVKKNVIDYKII